MPKLIPIHHKKLVKIFELAGVKVVGQKGSHITLTKPGARRRLVVPTYKQVPVFVILNNLKTAEMSRERYFELLGEVESPQKNYSSTTIQIRLFGFQGKTVPQITTKLTHST